MSNLSYLHSSPSGSDVHSEAVADLATLEDVAHLHAEVHLRVAPHAQGETGLECDVGQLVHSELQRVARELLLDDTLDGLGAPGVEVVLVLSGGGSTSAMSASESEGRTM
jgi:hypothetical protein